MNLGEFLLPGTGLRSRGIILAPGLVAVLAEPTTSIALCPGCKSPSGRIHARYLRTVADLPCQGRRVILRLRVPLPLPLRKRRLPQAGLHRASPVDRTLCPGDDPPGGGPLGPRLRPRRRGRVPPLGHSRHAHQPYKLLRSVRKSGGVESPSPRVLGGDDFAFRKGQTYGTILVDLERRRVIDLLFDREAATVAAWLRGHPGVEVVSRNRASAYSQAAREAAPDAMQVADRWHLLSNMRDVLERILHQRSAAIRELLKVSSEDHPAGSGPIEIQPPSTAPPAMAQAVGHPARKARFEEVRRLHGEGHSLRGIAASIGLHHRTIERYVRSDACPNWCPGRRRPSGLDRFAEFVGRRLREGSRNTRQILRELQAMGYQGGRTALRVYVRRVEAESRVPRPAIPSALAPRIDVPSARRLAVSAVRRPGGRSAEERRHLDILGGDGGEIGEAIDLAGKFAALIRGRLPGDLTGWLVRAEASSLSGPRSFARSLRQDKAAVRAGVTVEWSNGPVEGQVNRLKVIKRSMYGRARFDLLKARVLDAG